MRWWKTAAVVLPFMLLAGCSSSGGAGTADPEKSPPPKEFSTTFAALHPQITKRLGEATSASVCTEVTGQPLDGWIDELRIAPDAAAGAVNAYLIRIQLILADCTGGGVSELDSLAAAIRAATPTPTPSPSPSASATAKAAALSTLAALCRFAGFSWQAAADDGDFAKEVNQKSNVYGKEDMSTYRNADATIRAMKPCNEEQRILQQNTLDMIGWWAAEQACQNEYYDDASTLGDVAAWLACINPVYAGELPAIRAQSDSYGPASSAKCAPGYQPAPLTPSHGMRVARVITVSGTVRKGIEAARNTLEFGRLAKRGFKLLTERPVNPDQVKDFQTEVTLKIGEEVLQAGAEQAGDRLGKVIFPPIDVTLPEGEAKVPITVTETGPDGKAPSAGNAVTFSS